MSTLAQELLDDFEESGSENGDNHSELGLDADEAPRQAVDQDADMVLDGDEEPGAADDEDEAMGGTLDEEEDARAKVEKMHFGAVKDVRKVSTIMDRLEPLLKVIYPPSRARA